MMIGFGPLLPLLLALAAVEAELPVATFWGTTSCDTWANFYLEDYNFNSPNYLSIYSIYDLPKADLTIVGLYFADDSTDQKSAVIQQQLGDELEKNLKLSINNVVLNYYAPMSCALDTSCDGYWSITTFWSWWGNPFWTGNPDCYEYVGGCAPSDERLLPENWQNKIANVTTMPIFQDTDWTDAWENFGGGKGDLFIYDSSGSLYAYICTQSSCTNGYSATVAVTGGLLNDEGYDMIKDKAIAASENDGEERCADFEDDDTSFYYYYMTYYADDKLYYNDWDDDFDDDYNAALDSSTGEKEHNYHRHYHRSKKVDWLVYGGLSLTSIFLLMFSVIYYRRQQAQASTRTGMRYAQLSLQDPDADAVPSMTTFTGPRDEAKGKSREESHFYGSL